MSSVIDNTKQTLTACKILLISILCKENTALVIRTYLFIELLEHARYILYLQTIENINVYHTRLVLDWWRIRLCIIVNTSLPVVLLPL